MGEDFALHGCWSIATMVKKVLALLEEARKKDNGADNAEGGFALRLYQASRRTSPKSWSRRNS